MRVKIVDSGSKQNTYIIESQTSQLIVECGCKWSDIIQSLRFDKKISGCIVSHGTAEKIEDLHHKDHSLSQFDCLRSSIDVWGKHNLEHNKQYTIGEEWIVKPIQAPHGEITSYTYIIYNKAEKKWLYFATDIERLPQIAERTFDLMMLECNHSIDTVIENADKLSNKGFQNHLSQEYLTEWLERRQHKPKNLLLIHLSGSGNIAVEGLIERFNGLCGECYIATKGKEIIV